MEIWDDKDIAEARSNGIAWSTFYARVYDYGWTVEKAKTHPVRNKANMKYPEEWFVRAKEYGITRSALRYRLDKGWDTEKAITTPPMKKGEGNRHCTDEQIKQALKESKSVKEAAKKLGISFQRVYKRLEQMEGDEGGETA